MTVSYDEPLMLPAEPKQDIERLAAAVLVRAYDDVATNRDDYPAFIDALRWAKRGGPWLRAWCDWANIDPERYRAKLLGFADRKEAVWAAFRTRVERQNKRKAKSKARVAERKERTALGRPTAP